MDATPSIQIVLGLLVAVGVLVVIARRIHVPYPILLVIGGLLLGLIPGLPNVELRPELVLLLFLPLKIDASQLNIKAQKMARIKSRKQHLISV